MDDKNAEVKKKDIKKKDKPVSITMGSGKRKKGDINFLMIMPGKALSTKLRKIAKDSGKEMADVAEQIMNEYFIIKNKEDARNKKDIELKDKRKIIVSEVDKQILGLQKNIKLLK